MPNDTFLHGIALMYSEMYLICFSTKLVLLFFFFFFFFHPECIENVFLSPSKHILWVLIRYAKEIINVFMENKKNINNFWLK